MASYIHVARPGSPKVSIVMSVYNGERYLRPAMHSVLAQTFTGFEFIVVDDASTDATPQILASYSDPRIVLLRNENNLGLTKSLNRGIRASGGELVARQDADDLSMPDRLALQVAYMAANPGVALVGSGSRWVDGDGVFVREWRPPTDPVQIHQILLRSVPFLHGAFMIRRSCFDQVGGYDESLPVAQDCDLLLRLSDRWDLANLPDILYTHRVHEDRVSAKRGRDQERYLQIAQGAAARRRLVYGLGRLRLSRTSLPPWVGAQDRYWWARRFVWWSAASRAHGKLLALRFLAIALLLDPTVPDAWSYVGGILARKLGPAGRPPS